MAVGWLSHRLYFKKGEVMRYKIKLNLNKLVAFNFDTSGITDCYFRNISNIQNWDDLFLNHQALVQLRVLNMPSIPDLGLMIYTMVDDEVIYVSTLHNSNILNASTSTDKTLTFDCDLSSEDAKILQEFYQKGVIEVYEVLTDGYTLLHLYRLDDERDSVDKKLVKINFMVGNFKAPLGIKNIDIDVINYDVNNSYNYIYIPLLKRYYYVTNIMLVNKDYTRLQLQEDVLMSWQDLIRQQDAFITRQENSYTEELFDNRLPLKDVLTVEDVTSSATDTASGTNLTNITLDFSFPYYTSYHEDAYHILVSSFSNVRDSGNGKHPYTAPTGSGLPDLSSTHNNYQWFTFVNGNNFGLLMKAIINDDVSASYIQSILWLPFDPSTAYTLETGGVYAGDNYLTTNGTFEPLSNPETTSLPCRWATESSGKRGVCPYLIIKDFTYTATLKGTNVEPYANYEFFIPFVGWIKVESNKFFNKRILIYYNLDLVSGSATAFIYNHTDKIIIWSGTCQMGVKIDTSNTNQLENTRQKQANENNMILSLLTSALSIGVGIASENPVAVVGGVLSGGKAIASYVNSNNQIFERAQTTFGSGESAMHTNKDFKIRKTYHEAITITQSVYAKLQGYPSNQYSSLSALTGYTEIGEIHFDAKGYNIYQTEIDEIVALLKGGVIM